MLCFGDHRACPPLLAHAVEVMQWPDSVAQRMGVRNRGRDIRFGEKNRLGQSAAMRQMARQRGGKRAPGAVGGIRTLAVGLENFLFGASGGSEAEEIDRLLALTRWPPVITTFAAPSACRRAAASRIWSRFVTAIPVRTLASSRFGVTSSASGTSLSINSRVPAASSKSAPELDFRIGSSTTCDGVAFPAKAWARKSATTATTRSLPSMPMWTLPRRGLTPVPAGCQQ